MRLCQEIKCFWRTLSCLNIIVARWNFGTRSKILSFAFLLFLWDNSGKKLRTPSHFCEVWTADSYSVIIPYVVHEVQVRLWCDHKFPGFYNLKSNKRYIFFMNPRIKLQFSSYEVSSYIYIHKFCACNTFIIFHVDI